MRHRFPLNTQVFASVLFVSICGDATSVFADDLRSARTFDSVAYWGTDLIVTGSKRHGFGIDAGFVTALNRDISLSGWTATANLGFSRSVDTGTNTNAVYGSLLLGHQWHMANSYFALNSGVEVLNNDENPGGGATDGSEIGALLQYGFETKATDAFYMQSYGSVSTAYDRIYGHLKSGYKTNSLTFGGEFTIFDEQDTDATLRFGAFVGGIDLGPLNMIISAGYQHELEPGIKDGFYSQLGFSVPLSIRK